MNNPANHDQNKDADLLQHLLQMRRAANADRAAIDADIFQRFGRQQAVMFTDLVGFSRLVEAFGIIHFLQLIQESESLFLPLIEKNHGTCLKHEGDSLLVVFEQPAHALAAARAMVAATVAVNPGRLPEERIEVCIGLGWGQVLRIDQHEVWGAQVNAASKLGEDTAKGGEILVTEAFRQALPDLPFVECGKIFGDLNMYRFDAA